MTTQKSTDEGRRESVNDAVFRVVDATVAFDGVPVLRGIDLTIYRGSFVVLLGANGSGKTTLIRAVLGLQPLTSGHVDILGTPLAQFQQWHRIAFVPQKLPASTGVPVSALELVASATISPRTRWRRRTKDATARVSEALGAVGLADRCRSRIDVLSGGQQRRLMIARALAEGANVLVLDEPMAGVDLENQESLATLLGDLQDMTVVMVAHGLGTVKELVTRAIVLEAGRIVHDGSEAPTGWADISHHSIKHQRPGLLGG